MSVFASPDFDDHEQVMFCFDAASGLRAIIAVHDTHLGPGLGGCRIWPYEAEIDALTDVLRLSRGMTYKAALAGLDQGGGKSVIIADPRRHKTEALMRAMGRCVERLGGRYIVAEDSGSTVADIRTMAEETAHVGGVAQRRGENGTPRSGDPSPATAYGVFAALRAAVRHRFERDDLDGLRVAIQGTGSVGFRLARLLRDAGARLWVTDIFDDQVRRAVDELGAERVASDAIFGLDVDVFAPCALGAILDDRTLPRLRAPIVVGAANNQLAEPRHGTRLLERGILYVPDYVANAGGIIDIYYERADADWATVRAHLDRIGDTVSEILARAEAERLPTDVVADRMAEARFRGSFDRPN